LSIKGGRETFDLIKKNDSSKHQTIMTQLKKRAQPKINGGLLDIFDFDRFWEDDSWLGGIQYARVPATNIEETDDSFAIEMAAPGLKKSDFHIDVKDNVLEISVEKEKDEKEEKKNFRRREYSYYSFNRSFTLPATVKGDDIKAKYEDGILRLTLPKTPEAKKQAAKQISVS
jgi:HSP20 family protein